jgi:hypothetical protein
MLKWLFLAKKGQPWIMNPFSKATDERTKK